MTPIFFLTSDEMFAWMQEHHQQQPELFVGFHKKVSGRKGIDYASAVAIALCFGWIDSVIRPIDDERYALRFTPRRPGSVWSQVNLRKVEKLLERGLMQPAGIAAYTARKAENTRRYSFEQEQVAFDADQEATFRANEAAWAYFSGLAPSYIRTATWWVISAKKPETRVRRLDTLIELSAREEKLPHLSKYSKPRDQR